MEIDPAELTIPGKKDLRLKCKIAGFPPPAIKWFRDGNEIKVRKGVLVSQDASGGGNLVVEKCAMTDAGVYTARGINDVGQAETSCTVSVTQPMEEAKFTSLLRSAKAVEGSPIKLEGKREVHFEKKNLPNFLTKKSDDIPQCGNFRIFLLFRFCVKSTFGKSAQLPFVPLLGSELCCFGFQLSKMAPEIRK